tara:strand:+ start:59598 stop:60128 length:531 start_codon:yes stop_codon:yes gene_type:complete
MEFIMEQENNNPENNVVDSAKDSVDNGKIETSNQEVNSLKEDKKSQVQVDDSKFLEKAESQVNRVLKDLDTLAFHGSKMSLEEKIIDLILTEIREQTNVAKKQFLLNLDKKDFDNLNIHVNKVLREIKTLGELSNKHSSEYSEDHVSMIFDALKKKTNESKKKMKTKDKKDDKFSF